MKLGSRPTIPGAIGTTTVVWLLGGVLASGQAAPAQKPLMSEDVFKNVQVLRGIPVNEFMGTMGIFSAALGMSCGDCHAADDRKWENFAVDNPRKQMARRMVLMMSAINRANFGGRQVVTCYTCHRGNDRPRVTAELSVLYGPPPPISDDIIEQAPLAPPADQVLDKYIQALGGAQRLAGLTSFTATGTSVGYGPEAEKRPVEIFAKAPGQLTRIIHTSYGDSTTTYDGKTAWLAAPLRPVPVLELPGHDLDGAKLDAELAFPGRIKQALSNWRVGVPATISGRDVQVVQGTASGGAVATLYFDDQTGLLVRHVRYADSPVGRLPTEVDYSDYRDVAGVKMPHKFTITWLDGRDNFELTEIRPNVPVDAVKFAKPATPKPPAAPPAPRG